MREHLPEIGDVGGGLVGRQIGARNGFGLGETALQPDHEREVLPHARIDWRARPCAAQGRLRLRAGSSTERMRGRGSTIPSALPERSSTPSGSGAALPRGGPFGRARCLGRTECASRAGPACGRGRARPTPAHNIRFRRARARKRRARLCCAGFRSKPFRGRRQLGHAVPTRAALSRSAVRCRCSTGWRDIAARRFPPRAGDRRPRGRASRWVTSRSIRLIVSSGTRPSPPRQRRGGRRSRTSGQGGIGSDASRSLPIWAPWRKARRGRRAGQQ